MEWQLPEWNDGLQEKQNVLQKEWQSLGVESESVFLQLVRPPTSEQPNF